MEEKNLSEHDSLALIQEMISTAKREQKDDGVGWIIWGWLLFAASTCSFLNIRFNWGINAYFFWNAFGVVTLVLLMYEVFRFYFGKKKKKVKTYTADLFDKLNIGFVISLMLIILSMNIGAPDSNVPPTKGFALLLGLYGFWILIYGAVLNFKPSIIGAFITWAFAAGSLFVKSFEYTMLIHAAAVLCGYIIPGHIAFREFGKIRQGNKSV